MSDFNFIKYSDKSFYIRFLGLILTLWIIYGVLQYLHVKVEHLETLMFFFTLIPGALMIRRFLISYDGKASLINLTPKRITFNYALSKKNASYKLEHLNSIYIKDFQKRKTFFSDPFHYFLTFEFNDGTSIESTEITSSKAGLFMENFADYARKNKLKQPIDIPESLFDFIEEPEAPEARPDTNQE